MKSESYPPTAGSTQFRGPRRYHFWTWIAALASVGIFTSVTWLHLQQRKAVGQAEQILEDLHEARISLSKGFLNLLNASQDDASARFSEGMALYQQAIDIIRQDRFWDHGEKPTHNEGGTMSRTEFDQTVTRLNDLVRRWNTRNTSQLPPGLDAELRTAYHRIERQAQQIDLAHRLDFHNLNRRLDRKFNATAGLSAVLLAGLCVAIFFAARNEDQAILALRDSEQRIRLVCESLPQLVWTCRADGACDYLSRQWIDFTGLPESQQLGSGWLRQIHPDDRDRTIAQWNQAVALESTFEILLRVLRRDGVYRWFDTRAVPLRDPSGRVTQWIGSNTDVTEHRLAQVALQERQEQFRLFIEHNPAAMAMFDRDLHYLLASRRWLEDFHLTSQNVIGRCHYEVFPGIPERWKEIHRRCLAGAVEKCDEDAFAHPDGTVDWLRWEIHPWRRADGEIGGIIIFSENINERKRAEERIRHLNRVYAVLSDINQTIVRVKDLHPMLEAACRIAVEKGGFRAAWIGLTQVGSEGLCLKAHAGADLATVELLEGMMEQGGCEFTRAAAKTGRHSLCNDVENEARHAPWHDAALQRHYRSLGAFPLKDGDHAMGVFTIYADEPQFFDDAEVQLLDELATDISFAMTVHERETSRAKTERELKEAEERFRQAQKMEAIGQLAGGVAHDFNNILGAIMLQAELASKSEPLSTEARDLLGDVKSSAERAANLTRQLLAFSRRQVMRMQDLDLNQIVNNLAKMLRRLVGEDVRLHFDLHPYPLSIRADAGMMDQVLLNLVINARDAMPTGGPLTIKTGIHQLTPAEARSIPESRPGRYACLSVADSGCGISPESLTHIFEPFFTTKEPGKGTGLGLATVFGIARQHDGFVQVESEVGRGSTFRTFIPVTAGKSGSRTGDRDPGSTSPAGGTETILVAEDEAALRAVTCRILQRHGYTVIEASDGVDALKRWDEYRGSFDLLLTDIVMPEGINGRDLAQHLLKRKPDLKIIFTSGYASETAGRQVFLEPGQLFLSKPCTPVELLDSIRRCLDG